jgi:transposase
MPTTLFPVYPEGSTFLSTWIVVKPIENYIYYFNGEMVIFMHHKDDYKSFRFITSQMVVLNDVKQVTIVKVFEVSKASVKRWVKLYRREGPSGFYRPREGKKSGNVLTAEVLQEIQARLNYGDTPKEIEDTYGIKADTIRKAIQSGRLTRPSLPCVIEEKTKAQRNQEDSEASLGMGCTNAQGRIEAITKKK